MKNKQFFLMTSLLIILSVGAVSNENDFPIINDVINQSLNLTNETKVDVIVVFKEEINYELLEAVNVEVKENLEEIAISTIKATEEEIEEIQDDLDVESVELDIDLELFGNEDSLEIEEQTIPWGIERVNAPNVWNKTTGKNIKIAILDTGIDISHSDLEDNVKGGVSFVNDTDFWDDDLGHGTSVAGVISALDNEIGVVGVAPEAELYSVKVMGSSGGKLSNVLQGLQWAIDNNMDIVTMSLGIPIDSPALKKMVDEVYFNDIILIAGSGKNSELYYPAKYSSVIAVGAIDQYNETISDSGMGEELELVAPGENIISTGLNEKYGSFDGTSMAAPHVVGVIALIKEINPNLDTNEIRARLQRDAIDLGNEEKDEKYGYGLVQVKLKEENLSATIMIVFPEETNETKKEDLELNPVKIEIIKIDDKKELVVRTLFYDGNPGTQNIPVESGQYEVKQYFDNEVYHDGYNISDGELVIVPLHKVSPPVHQWLAYQAKNIWSTPEIDSYLPSSWSNTVSNLDKSKILYGVRYEDNEVSDEFECCWGDHPYCHHFWGNPHNIDSPGLKENYDPLHCSGLYQFDSSYQRSKELWDSKVIPLYKSGDKDGSYYWLGRVAHMLGDMSVPAHVHLDVHIVESYENYMAEYNDDIPGDYNYKQWTASGSVNINSNLYNLFYNMAEIADNFDSNDADGEYPSHYEGHNSAWEFQNGIYGKYDVSYAEARIHGNALIPEAMRHIAGLYRLFWIETSDSGCPGPCCDTYDHYLPANSAPRYGQYEYTCLESNSPTATSYVKRTRYYCDGSHGYKIYHSWTNVDTCGACEYCSTGQSSCQYYDSSAQCDHIYRCSFGTGNDYYNVGGEYFCQGYCDGSGNCDYAKSCSYHEWCDPDDDNDGIPDTDDNCPTEPGPAYNNGCPDTTPPNISINYPLNGTVYNSSNVSVNITTDELVNFFINWFSNEGSYNASDINRVDFIIQDLEEGEHTLFIKAVDYSNNSANKTIEFSVDIPICEDLDGDNYSSYNEYECPTGNDCDDTNSSIYPNAPELCNNVDDNCDGNIDTNLIESCGSGNCTGQKICLEGLWSNCDSYSKDAGTCALCDENGNEIYDETQDSDCNDGLFCNGQEECSGLLECSEPTPIDCTNYDLPEIGICNNDPDNNPLTWDYALEFESICNEDLDQCTTGQYEYIHNCSTSKCSAECESDGDCTETDCSSSDGCYDGTYRQYQEATSICLDNCSCSKEACIDYNVSITDIDEDGFDIECEYDCNDNNASINPSASEICDGIDNNCIAGIDEGFSDLDNDNIADCIDTDKDGDGVEDTIDCIIGNSNDINTNLSIDVEIGGIKDKNHYEGNTTVVFKEGNNNLIEFDYNFSNKTVFDLSNVMINKSNESDSGGFIIIKGIDLTSQGKTKTVYVDDLDNTTNTLCIRDEEIASVSEIDSNCGNGISITCNGTAAQYTCVDLGDRYKVTGLSHSGITEYTYVEPPPQQTSSGGGGGGGGGSSRSKKKCYENWECGKWSPCTPKQKTTRTCTDKNNCGTVNSKPSTSKWCYYPKEEEEEVTEPEEPETEDEPEEPFIVPEISEPTGLQLILGNVVGTFKELGWVGPILALFLVAVLSTAIYIFVSGRKKQ